MSEYLRQIISSFKETSKKEFSLNLEQDLNSKKEELLLRLKVSHRYNSY